MSDLTNDSRERERKHDLPYGDAHLWFRNLGNKVELHSKYTKGRSSGGTAAVNWNKCSVSDCLGEAITANQLCFAHADKAARQTFLKQVFINSSVLSLRGINLSEALYTEILNSAVFRNKASQVSINLSGATITDKLLFKNITFEHELTLYGIHILGGLVDFNDCIFGSRVNAQFVLDDHRLCFHECKFTDSVDISFSLQNKGAGIGFYGCEFSQSFTADGISANLNLPECLFRNGLFIRNANLRTGKSHLINLKGASIAGNLNITDTECHYFTADNLTLTTRSVQHFGPFKANRCELNYAQFESPIHIDINAPSLELTGRLEITGARFLGGGSITANNCELVMNQVTLGSSLRVYGKTDGSNLPQILGLQDSDTGSMSFSKVDMTKCSFNGARDLGNIILEPSVRFSTSPFPLFFFKRRCILDEFNWRVRKGGCLLKYWVESGPYLYSKDKNPPEYYNVKTYNHAVDYPKLEASQISVIYRDLRRSLESRLDVPGSADFYYGEMEMRKYSKEENFLSQLVIWVYWLLSGYGLSVLRAFSALVSLIVLGAFAFYFFGINNDTTAYLWALTAAFKASFPGLGSTPELSEYGELIQAFLRIIGTILYALLLLAIRSRVMKKP